MYYTLKLYETNKTLYLSINNYGMPLYVESKHKAFVTKDFEFLKKIGEEILKDLYITEDGLVPVFEGFQLLEINDNQNSVFTEKDLNDLYENIKFQTENVDDLISMM